MALAILERGEVGRPYNVGSSEGLSIRELAETVRAALGTKNEIRILGTPTNAPASVYVPNVDRAMTELGLRVRVPLDEAVRRSAAG